MKYTLKFMLRVLIVVFFVSVVFYGIWSIISLDMNIFNWSRYDIILYITNVVIWTYITINKSFTEFKRNRFKY